MELGVSYVAAHIPDHIETDMRHLREIGCTEVLFALQENHIMILTGAVKHGARIAESNGLTPYVVVWGYANTFGGGRMSKLMLEDIGLWRIQKDGSPVAFACLNNPRLIDRFIEITGICRENGYRGMFVDEPSVQECFCRNCQRLFRDAFTKDLKDSEGTPDYESFRRETVGNYTRLLCRRIKALDQNQKTFACLMPHDSPCFDAVASIPELDVFGTDPYWLHPAYKGEMTIQHAKEYTQLAKDACTRNGKSSQVWLNCWGLGSGIEEEIYTGGKALADVGCDSLYTWSFRGGLGTNEECVDPENAWASVVRLYRELSADR